MSEYEEMRLLLEEGFLKSITRLVTDVRGIRPATAAFANGLRNLQEAWMDFVHALLSESLKGHRERSYNIVCCLLFVDFSYMNILAYSSWVYSIIKLVLECEHTEFDLKRVTFYFLRKTWGLTKNPNTKREYLRMLFLLSGDEDMRTMKTEIQAFFDCVASVSNTERRSCVYKEKV